MQGAELDLAGAALDVELGAGQAGLSGPSGGGGKPRPGQATSFYSIPPVERTLLTLLYAVSSAGLILFRLYSPDIALTSDVTAWFVAWVAKPRRLVPPLQPLGPSRC